MKTNAIIKTAVIGHKGKWSKNLISFINFIPTIFCIGSYETINAAISGFSKNMPDIVLCNFSPADQNQKKIIWNLREKYPKLPILLLNYYDEKSNFDLRKTKIGNSLMKFSIPAGVWPKDSEKQNGEAVFQTKNDAHLEDLISNKVFDFELTPHEIRLLKLLVEGHNYTTAAQVLSISYNTVKFHMRRIYQKLEVNSKSAAVAKAMRYRLTE